MAILDPFLVEGVAVQEYFQHEKENYSQEKELEKARKQLARGQTPTSNAKRMEISSKTPGRLGTHLNKEMEMKGGTPLRPVSAAAQKR